MLLAVVEVVLGRLNGASSDAAPSAAVPGPSLATPEKEKNWEEEEGTFQRERMHYPNEHAAACRLHAVLEPVWCYVIGTLHEVTNASHEPAHGHITLRCSMSGRYALLESSAKVKEEKDSHRVKYLEHVRRRLRNSYRRIPTCGLGP